VTVAQPSDDSVRCLVLLAGQIRCAVPVHQVRQVVRASSVFLLPGSAPELLGLAELGGEPVPVLDLARLVQAPPGGTPSCPVHVIAEVGPQGRRERIALAADAAEAIVWITVGSVVGPPSGLVRGETMAAGHPVSLLDLDALEEP